MRWQLVIAALTALHAAHAHGDADEVDPGASYAETHMGTEHHLDSFDMESFFHLHDLNRDGILDVNELESIYGVHHEKAKKANGMSVEVHTEQAKRIVRTVLDKLDTNGDGVLTMREFLAGGVHGLPNFEGVEHLGHHYDAEGEYFLHHEEKYHNSPETQREEDYIHPEDIEHFMAHEKIEEEEAIKQQEYIDGTNDSHGQTAFTDTTDDVQPPTSPEVWDAETIATFDRLVEESPEKAAAFIAERKAALRRSSPPPPAPRSPDGNGGAAAGTVTNADRISAAEKKRQERADFARAQAAKFGREAREANKRGEWGSDGMQRPKDVADRLRRAVPYKYRMKKSWLEF